MSASENLLKWINIHFVKAATEAVLDTGWRLRSGWAFPCFACHWMTNVYTENSSYLWLGIKEPLGTCFFLLEVYKQLKLG